MRHNDLAATLINSFASESKEEEENAQMNRLTSLLAKTSLIRKLKPSIMIECNDPVINNNPDGCKNASLYQNRGEWLDAKKRQTREVAKNKKVMRLTKRRHFFDTDWDELWYFPGN